MDSETQKTSGKVKPSQKMGYITTVEDARKHLEEMFNLEDTKEKLIPPLQP